MNKREAQKIFIEKMEGMVNAGRGVKCEGTLDNEFNIFVFHLFEQGEISEVQFLNWDRHPAWPKAVFKLLGIVDITRYKRKNKK